MTSEWDYLYNKAHNEFLNYLATTGAFGLGTYLLLIGVFLYYSTRYLLRKKENRLLIFSLVTASIAIHITDFFNFSVVITNVYLFLIPAFVFILADKMDSKKVIAFGSQRKNDTIGGLGWTGIVAIVIIACYELFNLLNFWTADQAFALGYNLDRIGQFQQAYQKLHEAVGKRDDEPTFKDEVIINEAALAANFADNKDATDSALLANDAISMSNQVLSQYPNNLLFWKTRVRLFYTLSTFDQRYLTPALDAIIHAHDLAPTDPKISYNMGLLYGQTGDTKNAVAALQNAINLKPNYTDPYYALGLYYHNLATKNGKVVDAALQNKAVDTMQYILDHFASNDAQVLQAFKSWNVQRK